MMTVALKTLNEINQEALELLTREIGLANTLRFINQFTPGFGDYTEERRQFFGKLTVDDIVEEMKADRRS